MVEQEPHFRAETQAPAAQEHLVLKIGDEVFTEFGRGIFRGYVPGGRMVMVELEDGTHKEIAETEVVRLNLDHIQALTLTLETQHEEFSIGQNVAIPTQDGSFESGWTIVGFNEGKDGSTYVAVKRRRDELQEYVSEDDLREGMRRFQETAKKIGEAIT